MGVKRSLDPDASGQDDGKNTKKQKKGFHVGPDNLPDGTYRRHARKIKKNLIDKAKVRKEYEKLKQNDPLAQTEAEIHNSTEEPDMHPDRMAMIENNKGNGSLAGGDADRAPARSKTVKDVEAGGGRRRRQKPTPFSKEQADAEQRRKDFEERREAREAALREREKKREERERHRKAMAKARTGGPNGQRKLGRESRVLLEKVQRLMGE